MTRRTLVRLMFGSALGALLTVTPLIALAAPAGWTETQIASGTAGFDELSVSSSLVAARSTAFPPQVWVWWPGQAAGRTLQPPIDLDSLAVSATRAVWRQDQGVLGAIMTWKVGDPAPSVFAGGLRDNDYPAVSTDRIAWLSVGPDGQMVLTRRTSQAVPTTISALDDSAKTDIRVSGDRVVWNGWDAVGHTWQIYTRVAGEPAVTAITTDLAPHINPQVSGDRVVWMSQDEGGDGIVCTWKKGTGVMVLGPGPYEGLPQVSGDRVVWTSGAAGDTQVNLWQPGQAVRRLTTGPHWVSSVQISGDRVVWQDQVDARYEIVTWRAGESSLTTIAVSADELAEPVVGDNRVAWRSFDGTVYRVFTASGPTIATGVTRPTVSPDVPTHGHTATFRSYLTPEGAGFATGAKATIYLYRRESGHWRLRATVTMKRTVASGARVLLSAAVKLRYAGKWDAVVKFAGAAGYKSKTALARDFTVR